MLKQSLYYDQASNKYVKMSELIRKKEGSKSYISRNFLGDIGRSTLNYNSKLRNTCFADSQRVFSNIVDTSTNPYAQHKKFALKFKIKNKALMNSEQNLSRGRKSSLQTVRSQTEKSFYKRKDKPIARCNTIYNYQYKKHIRTHNPFNYILLLFLTTALIRFDKYDSIITAQVIDTTNSPNGSPPPSAADSSPQSTSNAASCFGGLQTFEKISMSSFENPSSAGSGVNSFGSGILVQQDDQALTSECVNLCRSQSNCLSFVIDYNKFECKSYATTQQELQQEFDEKYQAARSTNNPTINGTDGGGGYQASASTSHFQHLLPSASSNYFEKICLDGVANRNQFSDVCGQGRLWTIERVVDSFLDGYVEKEVTNVNNKDECSKLCIFETQFVCRSSDYDQHSRLCRLSKEDRRTQPQAMRYVAGSNRQYLENQCATPGPSSCVYETKKNVGIISMDALKFAQTVQECQMKCNQETTFNCRSYSFHMQRCFLSGDDGSSLNSNLIKLPTKQGWQYGEKKCLVELCSKGMFTYERITGFTLRSALSTPIDLMMPTGSSLSFSIVGNNLNDLEKLQNESSQTRLQQMLPIFTARAMNSSSNLTSTMTMMMASSNAKNSNDPLSLSESTIRHHRSANNLAITNHCRHSCDLGYLNCPAFTIDYKNNRCQRLDRNSQGRHHELVARDGFAYYEKICLRVPEIMSMCQDKYWIFDRVIGYELAPRLYEKSLKFVQSRRDCEEYCLEEKQFQCRSALYNDEVSECKLSKYDRRIATQEGAYYRNFNVRISYLENQCIRDHTLDKKLQCFYEQAKEEPAYPSYTEHIEMVPPPPNMQPNRETEQTSRQMNSSMTVPARYGHSYCEQLCNDNAHFECHSFGYYSSTAQCFLSGDDSISAGELASTPTTGFIYFEKRCRLNPNSGGTNYTTSNEDFDRNTVVPGNVPSTTPESQETPFQPIQNNNHMTSTMNPTNDIPEDLGHPMISNNNSNADQNLNMSRPPKQKPQIDSINTTNIDANHYKCGQAHTFVYQRISGFEPVGGFLTLLVKNNDQPGIVSECAELCKKAFECRAFVVDYNNNQCFAMLENSSVGLLSLRQTLGKDYFEGFCVSDHLLLYGTKCRNRTWIMDKIVDQAVVGVQHQKILRDVDRVQCRQACLEERLFSCKSAMFDNTSGDCKLYSIDRETIPQMRLLFAKDVDFFENQCQISSSSCPYDAIERDITIVTITKSIQARSTFDCEHACNNEIGFNCRSYTYLDQYPSLINFCLLSSDSRSTSQKGSMKEHPRALYAERNCYYRRPRYPVAANQKPESMYSGPPQPNIPGGPEDPYQLIGDTKPNLENPEIHTSARPIEDVNLPISTPEIGPSLSQGCEPHQYTFERTFGYDFRLAAKERAPIAPTVGIAIACHQECLRRGDKCQSFVVEYALPFQSCFLIETSLGANKKLLVKSPNSAYFEKVCLPRVGVELETPTHAQMLSSNNADQSMDIAPSYSSEPWSPQSPSQLPYYLQQQQLVQNYPSRSCSKLWTFERFVNHNFTATSDKTIENVINRVQCEIHCLNEAGFSCRSATYDYVNKICRLFKNTRRTIMSQFIDLESSSSSPSIQHPVISIPNSQPGTAQILTDSEPIQAAQSSIANTVIESGLSRRQAGARQIASTITAEPSDGNKNIDYLENTCVPEPSSCQYRQLYDLLSPYVDKINHAVSSSDCQRQCDLERLFSCKSINYDPNTRSCMLINEDLISLNRGQQASLLPKKNTIYSEKGNCEMISVQCNSQEMLVSINFDSPFRGRVMAKGNPEHCFMIGDGQTSIQFPIVFGPRCNSRQEGHNTFVNEVVIQQHPVIMTESDKTVRVMCAFEAPDQTITLKNPSSRDNKTGIDVGTPESSRTRHDKQHFNSIVSNKAAPPSVLLRILDQHGRDASMINLGDDLILRIQMQTDGQNSALGIFARNLAARSSNGESLLLINNEGCPVDPQVFPALGVDPKDGKSLFSTFKAFRFPSSGLVNFEVQIRFCPERCQPVECLKGVKSRSYGRKKRDLIGENSASSKSLIAASLNINQGGKNPLDSLSTVMKPGKAFQYVRELLLTPQVENVQPSENFENNSTGSDHAIATDKSNGNSDIEDQTVSNAGVPTTNIGNDINQDQGAELEPSNQESTSDNQAANEFLLNIDSPDKSPNPFPSNQRGVSYNDSGTLSQYQESILMHVDERVVPSTTYVNSRGINQHHTIAPYGRYPIPGIELHHKRESISPSQSIDGDHGASSPKEESTESDKNLGARTLPSLNQSGDLENGALPSSTEQPVVRLPESNLPIADESISGPNDLPRFRNSTSSRMSSKDVPLRFSILVGENQAPSNGWSPSGPGPVLVMNSTNVDLDHIVIPGKDGQFEPATASDTKNRQPMSSSQATQSSTTSYNDVNYSNFETKQTLEGFRENGKRNTVYDQTFDAMSSNSIAAEVKLNQGHHDQGFRNRPILSSETAASHDCQTESGSGKLWTIIWTGSVVIILNICLVILSLILYFKKVHLRQNHNIMRATSECGTHSSASGLRWPSVLLKSKNNLGTSLNTHEHFFCKLNSKPNGSSGHDFNWPNLSSSSSHSTISSMASPLPVTNVRMNQSRIRTLPGEPQYSLRNNFNAGDKSVMDTEKHETNRDSLHATYTNNIDETHSDSFQSIR